MSGFETLGLGKKTLAALSDLGFEAPTPIQEKVIPIILEQDDDIVALAQTGTGKTAAFGLPLLERIKPKKTQVQGLVLAPTRELCLQIVRDFESFAKHMKDISVLAVYGGSNIGAQMKALQKGVQVIVATPGRLHDLIRRGKVNGDSIHTVVLDEADEMLNMGFKEDIDAILEVVPAERRTLLFSATMPKPVVRIANTYMNSPVEITAGKKNVGAESVQHICYRIRAKDRFEVLKRIIDANPGMYGIIFCRTRVETQEIAEKLVKQGYHVDSLHGDLSQPQRDYVMKKFRSRYLQVLVATDVAARGLDVTDLTHVVNYNLPDEVEAYTHRSGRTGRAGKTGISMVLCHSRELGKLRRIEKIVGQSFRFDPIPGGDEVARAQVLAAADELANAQLDQRLAGRYLPEAYELLQDYSKEQLIQQLLAARIGKVLAGYSSAPDLNEDINDEPLPNRRERRASKHEDKMPMQQFSINIGKQDGARPDILIRLIVDTTGIRNLEIGRIDIDKSQSFFTADASRAESVEKAFNRRKFRGDKVVVKRIDGGGKKSSRKARPARKKTAPKKAKKRPAKKKAK